MRKLRATYSGKEHLVGNLVAKKGMRLFNEGGRLRQFSNRDSGMKNHSSKAYSYEWKKYSEKSEGHKQKLKEMEPDIVEKINMHVRLQKEREKEQIKMRLEEEKNMRMKMIIGKVIAIQI